MYTLEQIMEDQTYVDMCNMFLSLPLENNQRKIIEQILYNGKVDDYIFHTKLWCKDNPMIEGSRRISMAYLAIKNPETFEVFKENKISLFHGTNSNALPKILKYGLNSLNESKKEGIDVTTGERWSRTPNGRDFVSFTDVLKIAEDYSIINPKDSSFAVIIGITDDDALNTTTCRVGSDLPEIGIKNKLPKESIRVIGVPPEKANYVKKLVDERIKVVSIDDINSKFYQLNYSFGLCIDISEIRLNNFKEIYFKKFSKKDAKWVTLKCALSDVLKGFRRLRKSVFGKFEYKENAEYGNRTFR